MFMQRPHIVKSGGLDVRKNKAGVVGSLANTSMPYVAVITLLVMTGKSFGVLEVKSVWKWCLATVKEIMK